MNLRRLLSMALLLTGTLALAKPPAAAPGKMPMAVSTDWLAAHLNDPNLVILAVGGNPGAYSGGHIPGARFLDLRQIVQPAMGGWNDLPDTATLKTAFEHAGIGNQSHIVMYGENKGLYAARAYFTLDYIGLSSQAALLDGGLEKWKAERRPMTFDSPSPKATVLTLRLRPEVVADLAFVQRAVSSRTPALIDARSPGDFTGTPGGRSGHIPGARNVFWMDTLSGGDAPVLKPVEDLRRRYAAAGLKPGAKVVVYCRSGMQASFDYFTLKLAGYQPILYPGSFAQWSSTPGLSVEP